MFGIGVDQPQREYADGIEMGKPVGEWLIP